MSNSIFGMHEKALKFEEQRAQILANNLVNASTPGFKARDIDFNDALLAEKNNARAEKALNITNPGHMPISNLSTQAELKYRQAYQASGDGNTVDTDIEQAQFSENAVHYKATLAFIRQQSRLVSMAIKGE